VRRWPICDIFAVRLMTKVDIASMVMSGMPRADLDYRVVEFAAALPVKLKYRWGQGKRLLREAFGDLLPARFSRGAKWLCVPPIRGSKRTKAARRDLLLSPAARIGEFFGRTRGDFMERASIGHYDTATLWLWSC